MCCIDLNMVELVAVKLIVIELNVLMLKE
ncbi:hypothetical protein VCR12J2_500001 [Vibrio coralliirubri]|nr:hypothetical protein VCR12J2_500001 [Vibrio coralliirubri]